jgi:hypothetical protein
MAEQEDNQSTENMDSAEGTESPENTEGGGRAEGGDEIESAPPSPSWRFLPGPKARRRVALVLVVVLGCWAGGWFRAWSEGGLTAVQADQATVRLTLDGFALGQSNGCNDLGGSQTVLQIPLHNYSPGPVQIRSIAIDPPGQAPGAAQKMGFTIPVGGSTTLEVLIPIQLCTSYQDIQCPSSDVLLDATVAAVPESGRVHEETLPIGEWVPGKFLQLYEDAPFAAWGSSAACS